MMTSSCTVVTECGIFKDVSKNDYTRMIDMMKVKHTNDEISQQFHVPPLVALVADCERAAFTDKLLTSLKFQLQFEGSFVGKKVERITKTFTPNATVGRVND